MSNPISVSDSDKSIVVGPGQSLQKVIDTLPLALNHDITITLKPGTYAGFDVSGIAGRGSITIVGTMGGVTPTTGAASGSAASGTSTTIVKSSSLTANNFRGHFLRNFTRGVVRPVLSNTTTDIITHAIGSQAEGDGYQVQRCLSDVGAVSLSACRVPVTFRGLGLEQVATEDCSSVSLEHCKLQTSHSDGSVYSVLGSKLTLTDCALASGADVVTDGTPKVTVDTTLVHVGQVIIDSCVKFQTEIYALACTSNALSVNGATKGLIGLNAESCTATPLVLENAGSCEPYGTGLAGTTINTGDFGIEISGNTHLNIANYNTLSGGTGDVSVDGMTTTKTYAAIAAGGGTLMGDRASLVYGSTYGIITNRYLETTGDLRAGGSTLNYGFEGWTYSAVTATPGGAQVGAQNIGAASTDITVCASANDSVILWPNVSTSGRRFRIRNSTANAARVYPPVGGAINSLGTNNPYVLAAGYTVYLESITATTYKTMGVMINA